MTIALKNGKFGFHNFFHEISCQMGCVFAYRARETATLIRFGHFTKPKCRATSIFIPPGHVRVVEITMTLRSKP